MTLTIDRFIASLLIAIFSYVCGQSVPVSASEPVPFRIAVEENVLTDLHERLSKTRWPDQIPGSGWERGPDVSYLKELCEYWRTQYDWRTHEARINAWPQFTAGRGIKIPISFLQLAVG